MYASGINRPPNHTLKFYKKKTRYTFIILKTMFKNTKSIYLGHTAQQKEPLVESSWISNISDIFIYMYMHVDQMTWFWPPCNDHIDSCDLELTPVMTLYDVACVMTKMLTPVMTWCWPLKWPCDMMLTPVMTHTFSSLVPPCWVVWTMAWSCFTLREKSVIHWITVIPWGTVYLLHDWGIIPTTQQYIHYIHVSKQKC